MYRVKLINEANFVSNASPNDVERHQALVSYIEPAFKQLFATLLPWCQIQGFSFYRLSDHSNITAVSINPSLVKNIMQRIKISSDLSLNRESIRPIYDKIEEDKNYKDVVYSLLPKLTGNERYLCIVLEYDLGVSKDVFSFTISSDKDLHLDRIYHSFHQICLHFYRVFKPFDLKLSLVLDEWESPEDPPVKFSPFESLAKQFHLTAIQTTYLKLIGLGMDVPTISQTSNRSPRSVDKALSSIRNKFGLQSKNELTAYLNIHYNDGLREYFDNLYG
ncbi:helix-turn-helix transcriptional regulator [Vibrio marisflavi]|uniref:HTH luxR-type domain-containing protein n=1 Tax=Vibrio marisflavi CECT 7928 TaxID=634439 RepID=A0ABM9A6R7_9VIBR|nr:hypothetical protein [Vibrio marisflavi]CAH0540878.1 hypothetical protein VMF7928_03203 [Vibrio marisflavi CECT 7928]